MLEFNIRNQEISRIDSFSPAEKSVGYLVAKFNFKTDDWKGASKIAVFKNLKTKEEYDRKLEEDACIVPSEALSEKGQFEVSVYGLKDGQKITSNVATCNLNRTLSGGSMTEDNSLNAAEKLLLEAQNKLDKSGHAPNKFLGTDEQGNVVTKEQEEFSLEVANEEKLGGVKPLNKTDDMTLEVGVAKDGRLFAKGKGITVDSKLSEESTNPVQNKVLTKEVDALKEHNTQLKETIEKLQIKVTTEKASFHNIKDSANMKVVDFGMEGKTEQKQYSGKNKLDTNTLTEETINGVKFTPVYTNNLLDYILVNGTATANAYYKMNLCDNTYLTYDLAYNGCPSGGSLETYAFIHHVSGQTDSGNGQTLPANSQADNKFSISIASGTKVSNLKFYPMVRLATETDATYEPYTNGPSPNPDFKQDIENAGEYNEATGRYEHRFGFVNENLLPNNPEKWDIGKMLYWSASKGTEVGWATRVYSAYTEIEIQPNTNICFHNDMTNKYWVSRIVETDSNRFGYSNHDLYTSIAKNYADYSFKTLSNTVKLLVEVRLVDDTQTFTEADLQEMKIAFGYGNSVTYTPHASQPFTLTSPEPLTKWDPLIKRDGVWGWGIKHEKFNPEEQTISSVSYRDETSGVCTFLVPNAVATQIDDSGIKCNRAIAGNVSAGNIGKFRIYNNALQIRLLYPEGVTQDTSIEDAKSAFMELFNNVEYIFEYQTAEEVAFHPLPDEEQELLNNLETYCGVTNLYNDQGCPTWLTYIADPKLYLDNQLLEIKSAIV